MAWPNRRLPAFLLVSLLLSGCSVPPPKNTVQVWRVENSTGLDLDLQVTPLADVVSKIPSGSTTLLHVPHANGTSQTDYGEATDPTCTSVTVALQVIPIVGGHEQPPAVGAIKCANGMAWTLKLTGSPGRDLHVAMAGVFVPSCRPRSAGLTQPVAGCKGTLDPDHPVP